MDFLKNIFGKRPTRDPISLAAFGADIHSHLIPGIDDGAKNMADSVEMIRRFAELGFKKIVTTPHVMADYYKNTPEIILGGLANVKAELDGLNITMDMSAAAEYNLDDGLGELIEKKELLTFGKNYVLFELPFMAEPRNLQETIFNLQMAGYQPILAHPERYAYWYDNFAIYQELRDKGVLLQLNLLSLTGHYSPQTKKVAEKMVEAGLIDAIGTDCHRIEHLVSIEKYLGSKHFHLLAGQQNLVNQKI